MVYDSSESALYRAVRRYNGERTENPARETLSDKNCAVDENGCSKHSERHENCENRGNCGRCENYSNCGNKEHREHKEHKEHFEHKEHCDSPKRGFADNIFSDRDMLLIAGLIFVLLSEKADNKLILALALVLLG